MGNCGEINLILIGFFFTPFIPGKGPSCMEIYGLWPWATAR